MVRPLSQLMEESKRIAEGFVFVPQQTITDIEYRKLIVPHMGTVSRSVDTLTRLIPRISAMVNNYNPSQQELASLRQDVKEILMIARGLVKMQKEAHSVVHPPQFA